MKIRIQTSRGWASPRARVLWAEPCCGVCGRDCASSFFLERKCMKLEIVEEAKGQEEMTGIYNVKIAGRARGWTVRTRQYYGIDIAIKVEVFLRSPIFHSEVLKTRQKVTQNWV